MKKLLILPSAAGVLTGVMAMLVGLMLPATLPAQRGNIVIPIGTSITVPLNAQICADTVFANGPGHGTLTLADPTCLCSGTIVTPVELIAFSAALRDGIAILTWRTATETRNYGFEVQRRIAAADWTMLAFVPGHGSTTRQQSYLYADHLQNLPATCDRLSYRLRQVDVDGSAEYSPIVSIDLASGPRSFALLQPYPNPARHHLFIPFTLPDNGAVTIRLYNVAGQILGKVSEAVPFSRGSHTVRADVTGIPNGMYFIELSAGGKTRQRVITVSR